MKAGSRPIIRMKGITKTFPGVIANDDVDLDIYEGEIHALVGENGAGKSTLMSILYGLYKQDKGEIILKDKNVFISSPSEAIKNGIGMVFQHFMLVGPLSVAENVVLGAEPKKGFFFDKKRAVEKVNRISQKYHLQVDAYAKINSISVGMQQRVEIIKTLYRGTQVLILDEPTAVLTPQEIKEFFSILKALKKQGKAIILITHKLREVLEISDKVTVLRNGKNSGSIETKEATEEILAKMMVGRDVVLKVDKTEARAGDEILKISGVCCDSKSGHGIAGLRGIDLSLRNGEILGIAGVEGNGQTELLEILTGLRKVTSGSVHLNNENITHLSPRNIRNKKISNIPEDRHERGLVLNYSVAENLILGFHYKKPFAKQGIVEWDKVSRFANDIISKFDIRTPSGDVKSRSLSGGNQQKIIIARELYEEPDVLIASQPTRGVDVGAIEFIHKRILEFRDKQKAVLLISADLQEIISLSDRIAVMYEGNIVDIVDAKTITEEKLGLLMAGVKD